MGTYLHVLEGRIRIKVPSIKRAPREAADIEQRVRDLDSSIAVKANPTTGNVLVLFDPDSISQDRILALFGRMTESPETSARAIAALKPAAAQADGSSFV